MHVRVIQRAVHFSHRASWDSTRSQQHLLRPASSWLASGWSVTIRLWSKPAGSPGADDVKYVGALGVDTTCLVLAVLPSLPCDYYNFRDWALLLSDSGLLGWSSNLNGLEILSPDEENHAPR